MPICNPTIQLVIVDLYTKYEVSILNGCGDIFDKKVLWIGWLVVLGLTAL